MVAGYAFGVGADRADADTLAAAPVGIIVREIPGASDRPEQAVEAAGGSIERRLGIINGFAATVPSDAVATIATHPEVLSVTADGSLQLNGTHDSDAGEQDERSLAAGSMTVINDKVLKSTYFWKRGFTGKGIGVAIIDSGIAPVEGLTSPGKVVNGADLSFDSQQDDLRYLDLYGHGTHIAGIIAGQDAQASPRHHRRSLEHGFTGVAPQANILSVKVADGDGTADVSQVIAAIDWVVQHRHDREMNIRVLNLAFGTDGLQDYQLDPLAFAVEVAWRRGIVVVVAAGNDGNATRLRNPAYDPFVIAVGANDAHGTARTSDDTITDFSNCGTGERSVDVVAPGRSVISLRVPGSYADTLYPDAVVNDRFFKGTGTSQAAAMVSGAVALLLDQRPDLTPDQVKDILVSTARPVPDAPAACDGVGQIDLRAAFKARTPDTVQDWEPSTGTGSLDAARGTHHVALDGVELRGEQDIFGNSWDGASWSAAAADGASWSGGDWNGASWSGASWSGASWSGASWSGASWSGASWSGASWSGASWSGASWSGASWSGASWSIDAWATDVWL